MEKNKYVKKENLTVLEVVDMIIENYGPDITVGLNDDKDAFGWMSAKCIKHQLEFELTLDPPFTHWGNKIARKITYDYTENIVGKHMTYIGITCIK